MLKTIFLIVAFFVILISPTFAADLGNFPEFFSDRNIYTVVAEKGSAIDTISASKLNEALKDYNDLGYAETTLLESEYNREVMPNAIFVGNPGIYESHPLMTKEEFESIYEDKAVIKVFENNGFLQIMVAGTTDSGTREITNKLVNWETSGINGEEYVIDDEAEEILSMEEIFRKSEEERERSEEFYYNRNDYIENQLRPICVQGTDASLITEIAQGESLPIGLNFEDSKKVVKVEKITSTFVDIRVSGGIPPLFETDTLPKQIQLNEFEERIINGIKIVIGQRFTEDMVLLCITETEEHKLRAKCQQGCFLDNRCLPIGTRTSLNYCNLDKVIEPQKGEDISCNNNYECDSNVCVNNQCISKGFLEKIIAWFSRLFG